MKNLFDDTRGDDEFVAATRNPELREKRIAKLCRARNILIWIFILQFVIASLTLYFNDGIGISKYNQFFYGFLVTSTLVNLIATDLQIKFLKAARD